MGFKKIMIMTIFLGFMGCEESGKKEKTARSGKEIFTSICVACHGADGKAGTNGAADLSKSNLNAAGMAYIITNGSLSGKMASYKGILDSTEILSVAEYATTLKKP